MQDTPNKHWRELAAEMADFFRNPDAAKYRHVKMGLIKRIASTPEGRELIKEAIQFRSLR